jgi:putative ATP-binding cassette transporter
MFTRTRQTFAVGLSFWQRSPQRHAAWAILASLVLMVGAYTALIGWNSQLQKSFYDALASRDAALFQHTLLMLGAVIALVLVVAVTKSYTEQALLIRWREHLTASLMDRWLAARTYYRIERDGTLDNPDQRLTDDLTTYVQLMISLSLGFLSNLGMLGIMGWILWQSAAPVSFDVAGTTITIPGYMFWLALVWGLLQTGVTHLAGHKLSGVTVHQQRVEGDFRFALAKVRDSAEQIALYRGEQVEQRRLHRLFEEIRRNWQDLMRLHILLNASSNTFALVSVLVPIVALAPKVLSGELSVGTLMQDLGAFTQTASAIAWFARSYPDLFKLSAAVQRLAAMQAAMRAPEAAGIHVDDHTGPALVSAQAVALALPGGRVLTRVEALDIARGERLMVRGPSGVGKSTFLRAIAGLWPFGGGHIGLAGGLRLMFMPQKNYLPDGVLKEALTYPTPLDEVDDARCVQLLHDCRLPHLAERLHESARWGQRLSPGEQQRLAFARVLLYQPDLLFMDEATSALDNDTEAYLMTLTATRLPQCTVVSVAHRTTLEAFHDRQLHLQPPSA